MAGNGKAITLHFQKLSLQKDDLDKKLLRQQKRIDDAESEIGELTARIYGLRVAKKGQGGAQADREQTKKADKEIFLLEQEKQRLLLASDKIDSSMRALRERINNGRMDRMAKNRVFEGLKSQLETIKGDLVVKIERSNEIVDEKEQLDKGRDAKVKEFEDSVVEFEGRYQALMQELVELQERYAGQFSMKYSSTEATPLRMEESQVKIKLRLQQLDEWIAETKAYVDESDKKIRDLGDVFQMMMVKHRIRDLDELVTTFREAEQKKFQTYTYIQHVNREIKAEEKALHEIRLQIADFRQQESEDSKERTERLEHMQQELSKVLESTLTYNSQQEQHMLTIKEVANIARRMSNAVDSTTATIATESSKLRDDFARTTDLLEMSEFVSEESMTKCIGMLEDRIKHALRIFTDILKTSGGRSAAQAFHAQLRRDASLSPGLGSTGASRKSIVAGTLFGATNDSVAATASPMPTIDVDRMLMESGMGPTLPKTDSPLGSTKMPNFSKSAFLDGEEEALPDERPLAREELFKLAKQEIGNAEGLLMLDSGSYGQERRDGRGRHAKFAAKSSKRVVKK